MVLRRVIAWHCYCWNRLLAGNSDAIAQLHSILIDQKPLYALSYATLDTNYLNTDSALQDLQQLVEQILYPDDKKLTPADKQRFNPK